MNIKNLKRAAELQELLPKLEKARRLLSSNDGIVSVSGHCVGSAGVYLPSDMNVNVLNALNVKINQIKEEIETL